MSSTTVQRPMQPVSDWRPSAAELEAIVAEMRPLIAELGARRGAAPRFSVFQASSVSQERIVMKAGSRRDNRVDCLRSLELFAACSKKELREISALTTELDIGAGRVLVAADAHDRQVFVIVEGSAEVRVGARVHARLDAGAVFGDLALLSSTATVCAATPMVVLVLSDHEFRSLPERVRAEAEGLMAGWMFRQDARADVDDARDECLDAPEVPGASSKSAAGARRASVPAVEIRPIF